MKTRATLSFLFAIALCAVAPAQNTYPFPATGNVGIGTTTPDANLELKSSGTTELHIDAGTSGHPVLQFEKGGVRKWGMIGEYPSAGRLSFYNYAQYLDQMVLSQNGSVGIGTVDPVAQLEIVGHSDGDRLLYINETDSSPVGQVARIYRYNNVGGGGNASNALLTLSDHSTNVPLQIENHSGATIMTVMGSGAVGIGTATPTQKLEVNGTIRAKEVIVESSGWPDFVFEAGYPLRPLSEVAVYVAESGRLPDAPSAAEVDSQGLSLGDAQRLMMQKIEELTLYAIEQDERIEEQQKAIDELRAWKAAREAVE